jgi:ketosteroid isomerase-like protein
MTDRDQIETKIKALWNARLKEDIDGTLRDIADDAVFEINARGTGVPGLCAPVVGKPAIREAVRELFATWDFKDWKALDFMVDGETALVRWSAKVVCTPTGKSDTFDCYDLIKFRDGKIIDYRQATDTAMLMRLATA